MWMYHAARALNLRDTRMPRNVKMDLDKAIEHRMKASKLVFKYAKATGEALNKAFYQHLHYLKVLRSVKMIFEGAEGEAAKIMSAAMLGFRTEEEEEEVKEDPSLSEAIDFEFEVVEKLEETPVLETEEVLISPHDDSPFDKKIKETATKKNDERKEHLKKFNHAFKHSMNKIDEFEKQPAYKRMGVDIEESDSPASDDSRMSVENDDNDEIQLRSNNSFLHDNVD